MKVLLKKIDYLKRLVATGLSFALFGLGGLLYGLLIFPLIFLFFREEGKRKIAIRKTISFSFKCFMYFMHFTGILYFRKENIEFLKDDGGKMLIANHPTLIDVVAIIAYTPNANCIIKKELFENFFLKKVVKAAGYIPNVESKKILEGCRKAISEKDVLIIFPEGTRTKPGRKLEFQRGAAHIALALGCPVRCIEITCRPLTLSKGNPWYKIPVRRVDFSIKVKEVIFPTTLIQEEIPRPLAARRLTRDFLNQYCADGL